MSMGAEGAKAVSGFVKVFQNEPLSLALVAMNICLMAFFYFLLTTVAAQREREIGLLYADKKEVRDMLAKCVVPTPSQQRGDYKPSDFDFMRTMNTKE